MEKYNTRQNRITICFLAVFCLGVWVRQEMGTAPKGTGAHLMGGLVQTVLFSGLIIAWGILLRHRLIQAGIRRHLTEICFWMVFWFLLRGLKYYLLPSDSLISRYVWYGYYIPMMMVPTCAILAVLYIGKKDEWRLDRSFLLIFLIPAVISLAVLTNDLHQLVFSFPSDAAVWSDSDYSYGPLYLLPFSWFLISAAAMLHIMRKRCRIPKSGRLSGKLPLIPLILGVCYSLAYAAGWTKAFNDLIITICALTVLTFESAIRVGFIRSNSNYLDLFHRSSIDAQIYNSELELQYRSRQFPPYRPEVVKTAVERGSYVDGETRYTAASVKGGYVIWEEDLKDMIRLQRQLESANDYLEDRSLVLGRYYETRLQRKKLEEQNRLYDEMQRQTREKVEELDGLLSRFDHAGHEEEQSLLLSIGLITAYLKRKNNLIFLAKDQKKLPVSELKNCILETVRMLEAFGVTCAVYVDAKRPVTYQQMVRLYDAFENAVEKTAVLHPVYFVTVTENMQQTALRIRIAEIGQLPDSLKAYFRMGQQEDGEYLLEMLSGKEAHEQ